MILCLLIAADVISSSAHLHKSVDGEGDFVSYNPDRPTYFNGIEKANQVEKAE